MTESDNAREGVRTQKQGISNAECGRRVGLEAESIRNWDRQGWVVRYPDRSINFDATMQMVNANRSPTNGGKPDRGTGAIKPPVGEQPSTAPSAPSSVAATHSRPQSIEIPSASDGINAVKAFRERIKAEKDLIELRQKLSELVPVATAERLLGAALSSLVQNLENIPARVAPIFSAMTDEFEIRAYLQDEIDKALHSVTIPDFSQAPPAEEDEEDGDDEELAETSEPPSKEVKRRDRRSSMA